MVLGSTQACRQFGAPVRMFLVLVLEAKKKKNSLLASTDINAERERPQNKTRGSAAQAASQAKDKHRKIPSEPDRPCGGFAPPGARTDGE